MVRTLIVFLLPLLIAACNRSEAPSPPPPPASQPATTTAVAPEEPSSVLSTPSNFLTLRDNDARLAISPDDAAVIARLDAPIDPLKFDNTPLEKVFATLRTATNTHIFTNWKALDPLEINRETPITLELPKTSYRQALKLILAQASKNSPEADLDLLVDETVITISTREDLNSAKYQIVCVYDIRSLLPQTSNPPSTAANNFERSERIAAIIKAVTTRIAPDSWRNAGGTVGSIRELDGQLIINHTLENQRTIHAFIKQLLQNKVTLPPPDPSDITRPGPITPSTAPTKTPTPP